MMGISGKFNSNGTFTFNYDGVDLPAEPGDEPDDPAKRTKREDPSWKGPVPKLPKPRVSIIFPGDRIPAISPDSVTIPWNGIAQFSKDLKKMMPSSAATPKGCSVNVRIRPGSKFSLDDMLLSARKVAGRNGGPVQLILTSNLLKK